MMKSVLFICVENRARSQIAEGMAKHFLGHSFHVFSAGSRPAERVHPMAIAVMAEVGIDISKQIPKSFEDVDWTTIDYAVLLCSDDGCPLLPKNVKLLRWPLPDPASEIGDAQIKKFRKIRDELRDKIHNFEESLRFNG